MKSELERIYQALEHSVPYLGICLGMQTLAKAAGAEIYKNHVREIGWKDHNGKYYEINLTDQGTTDPLFVGLQSPLKIFHLHGETVRVRDGISLLATGEHCQVQAIKVGEKAYGLQGHLELTTAMFEQWLREDPDLNTLDKNALRRDYLDVREEYEKTGRKMITNFLKIARIL